MSRKVDENGWLNEPIEYAPVKYGRWEYHSNGKALIYTMNSEDAYCSRCGFHLDTTEVESFDDYNFCPRCGARMNEVGREDDE